MKTLSLILLLAALACGQPTSSGSISEFHTILTAESVRIMALPGPIMTTDLLEVFVKVDRSDVNQYTITASYVSDGQEITQSETVKKRDLYYNLVVFKMPFKITSLKVSVAAEWKEVKETAVF